MPRPHHRFRSAALVTSLSLVLSACVAVAGGSEGDTTTRAPRVTTTTEAPFTEASLTDLGDPLAPGLGNAGYDATHYHIDLRFDPEAVRVEATTTIEATALAAIDEVAFDFTGGNVGSVRINGARAEFAREATELVVSLPDAAAAGDTFTAEIEYSGTPGSEPSRLARLDVGWLHVEEETGTWHLRSDPDGAYRWFPVNDHPSDKATYLIDIEVPIELAAAASGTMERTYSGVETSNYRWVVNNPVAAHRVTAVIGGLELVVDETASGAVEIRHLLPPDMAARPPGALATVDRMVRFLEERFGRYPYDSFGVAVVDGPSGGLGAHTWAVLSRAEMEADDAELRIVNHLASQWFGDSLTPATWSDVWLWASFSRYAEWLWIEAALGETAADVTASTARRTVERSPWPPPDEPDSGDVYVGSVFLHGAATLHAMRLRMGDAAFYDLIAGFYADHAGGSASTADFSDAVSEAGGREIRYLYDTWFDATDMPGFPDR